MVFFLQDQFFLKRSVVYLNNEVYFLNYEGRPMEVAVTLSLGGNQAADTSGGAEQKMMPGKVRQLVNISSRGRKLSLA